MFFVILQHLQQFIITIIIIRAVHTQLSIIAASSQMTEIYGIIHWQHGLQQRCK